MNRCTALRPTRNTWTTVQLQEDCQALQCLRSPSKQQTMQCVRIEPCPEKRHSPRTAEFALQFQTTGHTLVTFQEEFGRKAGTKFHVWNSSTSLKNSRISTLIKNE